jgi:cellulose biosynthesis protein BcsQ
MRFCAHWQVAKQTEPLFPTVGLPTKDLHRQVKQHLPGYQWIIVDGPPRIIGREVVAALADYPILVLASHISQRVAFAESAASGMSGMEIDPNSVVSQEIMALAAEAKSL